MPFAERCRSVICSIVKLFTRQQKKPTLGDPHYKPRPKRTKDHIEFLRANVEPLQVQILCLESRKSTPFVDAASLPENFLDTSRKPTHRVVIVGDVHGCAKEFTKLLEKVSFAKGEDILVLTGDIVAKGEASQDALKIAMTHNAFFVRGNHDWEVLKRRQLAQPHVEVAIGETAMTHDHLAAALNDSEVSYLASGPHMLYIPAYDTLVVHAAVRFPEILQTNAYDAMHARNIVDFDKNDLSEVSTQSCTVESIESSTDASTGSLPKWLSNTTSHENTAGYTLTEDIEVGTPWAAAYPANGDLPFVVFGHDARRGLQECENACGIDTGCAYGKKLTALILPGRELVSVDRE